MLVNYELSFASSFIKVHRDARMHTNGNPVVQDVESNHTLEYHIISVVFDSRLAFCWSLELLRNLLKQGTILYIKHKFKYFVQFHISCTENKFM